METWKMFALIMIFALVLMFIKQQALKFAKNKNKAKEKEISYNYKKRDSVMTATEQKFFNKLQDAVKDEYLIFPQIHLSSLLNHNIKGQSWKGAFSHINGKSVDFVLADKNNLETKFAIELDDNSHDKEDRKKRDITVENIFDKAGIKLVRFKNSDDISSEIINAKLKETSGIMNQEKVNENLVAEKV